MENLGGKFYDLIACSRFTRHFSQVTKKTVDVKAAIAKMGCLSQIFDALELRNVNRALGQP